MGTGNESNASENENGGTPNENEDESTTTTTTSTTTDDIEALKADVEKWKSLSRKHETTSKANKTAADELAQLKASQMSEQDKAVEQAKTDARAEATSSFGQKLAAAEIKAALTGIVPDPAEVIEDLNLAKYVTDTGDVDAEAVTKLRDKFASIAAKPKTPDLKQGNRGGTQDEPSLDEQIATAMKAGNTRLAIALQNRKLVDAKS